MSFPGCSCGGTYGLVGGGHTVVIEENPSDPWADHPKGRFLCKDCGRRLPMRTTLVVHGPCARLGCDRCGRQLSNAESLRALEQIGYTIVQEAQ